MAIDLSGLSEGLGLSVGVTLVMLIAYVIIAYYLYQNIKKKESKQKFMWGAIIVPILLLGMSGAFLSSDEKTVTITDADIVTAGEDIGTQQWQEDYKFFADSRLANYDQDIENTDYYDYDNPVIASVAKKIAAESTSTQEAIDKTLEYVYRKVNYVVGEADSSCFDGTAPEILLSGNGQCDTQSITVISILRKMGIAAKPVGGCIVPNPACKLQALFQSIEGFRQPRYSELTELPPDQTLFSRGDVFSRTGGLHAFVVAWVPDRGWVTLESTTGEEADHKCWFYHVELYPEDDQKDDICVSQSWHYAKACQLNDLASLDEFGLGLSNEVFPK